MRREWFDPFESSMNNLGIIAVWWGEDVRGFQYKSCEEIDGLVVELSGEVLDAYTVIESGTAVPLAGLPVGPDSDEIATKLGITDILRGEDDARRWLESLRVNPACQSDSVIAVWGTAGAPGATSVAVALALGISKTRPTLLVDADFVAPSMAEILLTTPPQRGLLGALRVARNDNPSWEAIVACAAPALSAKSLQVLAGVRPGTLGRVEAASMSTLIDAAMSAGMAAVVEVKTSIGNPESDPERVAAEAILSRAHHLICVGWGTDVGISRLVRAWHFLDEIGHDAQRAILVRAPEGGHENSLAESTSALWGFTGCPDVCELRHSRDGIDFGEVSHLLEPMPGSACPRKSQAKTPQAKVGSLISGLLKPRREMPLP